jgi:hypothetical protein
MRIKHRINRLWFMLTSKFRRTRIVITSARLSGDGSFVDIRYWLSRPDKLMRNSDVYLLDAATKEKFYTANIRKCGKIRTRHGKYTANGVILFYNRDNIVKKGSKVILAFGSYMSEHAEVV